MKTGNVTGNVYKRSVHRKIEINGIGVKGAEYGEGCAFLTSENVDAGSSGGIDTGAAAGDRRGSGAGCTGAAGRSGGKLSTGL